MNDYMLLGRGPRLPAPLSPIKATMSSQTITRSAKCTLLAEIAAGMPLDWLPVEPLSTPAKHSCAFLGTPEKDRRSLKVCTAGIRKRDILAQERTCQETVESRIL